MKSEFNIAKLAKIRIRNQPFSREKGLSEGWAGTLGIIAASDVELDFVRWEVALLIVNFHRNSHKEFNY